MFLTLYVLVSLSSREKGIGVKIMASNRLTAFKAQQVRDSIAIGNDGDGVQLEDWKLNAVSMTEV